jgi:hypothetical protein
MMDLAKEFQGRNKRMYEVVFTALMAIFLIVAAEGRHPNRTTHPHAK